MPRTRKFPEARLDAVRQHLCTMRDPDTCELPPVLALRRLADEVNAPGGPIAWLAAYDPTRQMREAAGMALFLAARDPGVPAPLRRRIGRSAAPWLLRALHDPDVPDDRKYPLAPLLSLFGVPLPEEAFRSCFQDLDGVRAAKAREAMRQILDRPDHLERVLDGLEQAEDDPSDGPGLEAALEVAVAICEQNPNVGALLAGVLVATAHERRLELDLAPRALELIAATRCGRAAWVLGELGRSPALGEAGERARELAMALNDLGVASQAPRPGAFSHGFVGPVDGLGTRRLVLFVRTDEGTLHGLLLRVNDLTGVEDVGCVYHEAATFDEGLRRGEPTLAPCDLSLARQLLGDALAIHEELDRPPPGRLLLFRAFFGPEPIAVDRRAPRLGAYLLETLVPSPDLALDSELILEHPAFGGLWSASEATAAVVIEHARGARSLGRGLARAVAARRRSIGRSLAGALTETERALLLARMAANLELEARAGRARLPHNRVAARTWWALQEGLVAFEDVPYVRALCARAAVAVARELDARAWGGGGGGRRRRARRAG
ncbi:MAG: hypothetical protein KF878_18960 [Planctomycetes bacterium]|nr:hypothetical protein [Planctomycetota bacterium]